METQEIGGYSAQSTIVRLHPDKPIIARSCDFDVEIKDLAGAEAPYLLKFPLQATSWKIQDFCFAGMTLYCAVTVAKRGTQVVAFNLATRKVDSQVALQGCAEPKSVLLQAYACKVWALCNV